MDINQCGKLVSYNKNIILLLCIIGRYYSLHVKLSLALNNIYIYITHEGKRYDYRMLMVVTMKPSLWSFLKLIL
jgi:hypothetical protein